MRQDLLAKGYRDIQLYPRPWTQPGVQALTPKFTGCGLRASSHAAAKRQFELLDLAFAHRCRDLGVRLRDACEEPAVRAKVASGLWANLSQSIKRKPWMHGEMPTYTTSSRLYSFEYDEKVEPEEAFAVYGRPVCHQHLVGRRDVQDLVGNCMAAQAVGAVAHSVLLSLGRRIPSLWDSDGAATSHGAK